MDNGKICTGGEMARKAGGDGGQIKSTCVYKSHQCCLGGKL